MLYFFKKRKKVTLVLFVLIVLIAATLIFSIRPIPEPEQISYGVSFSKLHAKELGLDWKEAYLAILDDLGVKTLRLSAHWPEIEPKRDEFKFSDFDYQINEAQKRGVEIVVAIGYRLPGWPECHIPEWFLSLSGEEKENQLMQYIEAVVNRYKSHSNIRYWQIENEAFLTLFAKHVCGDFLDEELLKREIELVKKLDPAREIMLTDSGELGLWYKAYKNSDVFGTSMYLYVWNKYFGPIRYPMTPGFFKMKTNLMGALFGSKEVILSELSAEPWLLRPIVETPLEEQFKRMDLDKFNKIIKFAQKSGFDTQLLWGAEWWYWLKEKGYPEFWERARGLFD